jgi:hypothetical protein
MAQAPEQQQEAWRGAFPHVVSAVRHALEANELPSVTFEDAEAAAIRVYMSRLDRPPRNGKLPRGAQDVFDKNHHVLMMLASRDPLMEEADGVLRGVEAHNSWHTLASAWASYTTSRRSGSGSSAAGTVHVAATPEQEAAASSSQSWRRAQRQTPRKVVEMPRCAWAVLLAHANIWQRMNERPLFSPVEAHTSVVAPDRRRQRPAAVGTPTTSTAAAARGDSGGRSASSSSASASSSTTPASSSLAPVVQTVVGRWADDIEEEDE